MTADQRGDGMSEHVACRCGHAWERHGPEVPGCVECRCRRLHAASPDVTQRPDGLWEGA